MGRAILLLAAFLFFSGCTTAGKNYVYYKVRVKSGDTLGAIADRFDADWQQIAKDNRLADPDALSVGEYLIVRPGPRYSNPGAINAGDSERRGLLFGGANRQALSGSLRWPAKGSLSSLFGKRGGRPHEGIDIRANRGSPIYAAADGKVTYTGWRSGYGRTVIVTHANGEFSTLYAHCHEIKTRRGAVVKAGEQIATIGRSGNATGNHLHFEVRDRNNRAVDPMLRLRRGEQLLSRADD